MGLIQRRRDRELSQAQASIIGRDQAMAVDAETIGAQARGNLSGQQRIQEHPPAQHHDIKPVRVAEPNANRGDDLDHRRVKPPPDRRRFDPTIRVPGDRPDQGAGVD
jgi:hypothetical protein